MILGEEDAKRLINEDLYNELRWMLVAASEWQVCFGKLSRISVSFPSHLQVLAMDSACVHIRSLYEFFIYVPSKSSRSDTAYANRDFGISVQPTQLYNEYIESLNKRIFHLDNYRPAPTARGGGAVKTDLNQKITDIAQDVLNVWDIFAKQLPQFETELSSARQKSISDAERAAISVGGSTIFS